MKITITRKEVYTPKHQDRVTLLNCMMGGCSCSCEHFKELTPARIIIYLKQSHPDLTLDHYCINNAVAMLCMSEYYKKCPNARAQILDCLVSEYPKEILSQSYRNLCRERTPMQIAIRQKDTVLIEYLVSKGVSVVGCIRGGQIEDSIKDCIKDALYNEICKEAPKK